MLKMKGLYCTLVRFLCDTRVIPLETQRLISQLEDQTGERKFKSTGFGGKKVQEHLSPKCSRAAGNSFAGRVFVTSDLIYSKDD